jgi:hypothetical protein
MPGTPVGHQLTEGPPDGPSGPSSSTAPVAGVAEPQQSTVTAVLRAALQGVFGEAEADRLIERIRARAIPSPSPIKDGFHPLDSPNRTS